MFRTERPYVSVRHKIRWAKKALHIELLDSLISFKAAPIRCLSDGAASIHERTKMQIK